MSKHAKFQRSSERETFSKLELNRGGRKNVRFFNEKWSHLENGQEIDLRLLYVNRKWHIGFQMTRKSLALDDLEDQYCNRKSTV